MNKAGFTLLELLIAIGVVAVLAALASAGYSSAIKHARMAQEISASRTLISAYLQYPNDHDGRYLPAIDKSAGTSANPVWFEPEKRNITFSEAPHRYPFRLAPYFGYQLKGTILLNGAEKQLTKIFGKSGGFRDYGISLSPALGLNAQFCGGYMESSGRLDYASETEAMTRQSQATRALLVFASAGGSPDESTTLQGYFKIGAPTALDGRWSSAPWVAGVNAGLYGAVDARHNGKVVCAFSDGSTRLKTIEELRDMRLWSRNAAAEDKPDYQAMQ